MQVKYSGLIYVELLPKYLAINDGFTLGQKLTQIEKQFKKRFFDMSDEDIYDSLKSILESTDYFKDENLSDEEFNNWRDKCKYKIK